MCFFLTCLKAMALETKYGGETCKARGELQQPVPIRNPLGRLISTSASSKSLSDLRIDCNDQSESIFILSYCIMCSVLCSLIKKRISKSCMNQCSHVIITLTFILNVFMFTFLCFLITAILNLQCFLGKG